MKRIFKRIRNRWLNYLNRLAKANEKEFGNKRLDCCNLHKK